MGRSVQVDLIHGLVAHKHPIDWAHILGNFFGEWDPALGYPIPPGEGYWIINGFGTLGGTYLQPGDYLLWWGGAWSYIVIPRFGINTVVSDLTAGWNSIPHGLVGTIRMAEFLDNTWEMINMNWKRNAANIDIYTTTDLSDVEITVVGSNASGLPSGPAYKQYEYGVDDDTTFPVPAGYILVGVIFVNNTAHALELDIGTSLGGHELGQNLPIPGNDTTTIITDIVLDMSGSTTIYINDDSAAGGLVWSGSDDVDIFVITKTVT